MGLPLDIVSYESVCKRRPDIALAAHGLFITPEALEAIAVDIGSRPAESGAKLFGPSTLAGVDVVEFDHRGSAVAGPSVYAPDTEWSDERIAFWLAQEEDEMRLWTGDVHSHPGGMGYPSAAVGKGLGDLGYAAEVLAAVEWMDAFYLPIVTLAQTRRPRLWSWVVTRDEPSVAQYAEVHVAEAKDFPPRSFNPAWEANKSKSTAPGCFSHPLRLDLAAVAEAARTEVRREEAGFVFTRGDVEVSVALSSAFPADAPEVHVRGRVGDRRFDFAWRTDHPHRAELRLKRLVNAAITFGSQEF